MILSQRAKFYSEDTKKYEAYLEKRKQKQAQIEAQKEKMAAEVNKKKLELLKKAKYVYLNTPISERHFKKLYEFFKNTLYVNSKGDVIDVRRNKPIPGSLPVDPNIGDKGKDRFKIMQVLSGKILSNYRPPSYYSSKIEDTRYYCLSNINTKGLIQGRQVYVPVIMTGTYKYISVGSGSNTIPMFEVLSKITRKKFSSYLRAGNKLFVLKPKKSAEKICEECEGTGKVSESRRSLSYILCPSCKGKKVIALRDSEIDYKKVLLRNVVQLPSIQWDKNKRYLEGLYGEFQTVKPLEVVPQK